MCAVCLRPSIDMHKGKVKQIVGSTLRDLKGEDGSALVTNFESDETAAEFANLHKEDGLMGGADDLSKSIAIEQLFIFPLLNLLRGFKKSRGLAGWRWYQCKQCFELRRGRSQPCYCYFSMLRTFSLFTFNRNMLCFIEKKKFALIVL
ncbi:hypothetical protein OIU77_021474 [Salix suchowensis]|uniref:Uncharacterized protein n=1 Tax=Salix suchowensis TaxID=1278906 RepID=A0ABQ9CD98_9ROSI|nr:hypothetical protein OIU77_021474 [Salix suchowensis]